jgi:WD40 repeat protein
MKIPITFPAAIAYRPDGAQVAAGGWDGKLQIWDAETGQQLFNLEGHTGNVTDVAFSPDCKRLASVSDDGTLRLWDTQTGQEVLLLKESAIQPGRTLSLCWRQRCQDLGCSPSSQHANDCRHRTIITARLPSP